MQLAGRPQVAGRKAVRSGVSRKVVVVKGAKTANGPTIAIVGITGAVGQEFLTVGGGCFFGFFFASLPVTVTRVPSRVTPWHNYNCCCLHHTGAEGAELPLQQHQDAGICQVGRSGATLPSSTLVAVRAQPRPKLQ